MDESSVKATPSSSSSTTAAAAMNSSKVENPPANIVKLIIKASNQQYEDHLIESDPLWTVKRIKTQLSLVYPSKPPINEQKLIYAGQLLNDKLVLKDVIRNYKDVCTQNHIFHLVVSIKNIPTPVAKPSQQPSGTNMADGESHGDGLRHRNVVISPEQQEQLLRQQQQQEQQQYLPYFMQQQQQFIPQIPGHAGSQANANNCPHTGAMPFNFTTQYNMQAMATQQIAMYTWMQQVYSQYMEQYSQLSQNHVNPLVATNPFMIHMPPMPMPMHPLLTPNATTSPVIPMDNRNAAAAMASVARAGSEQQPQPAQPAVANAAVEAVGPAAAPVQRRFPNIVQDEVEHRDWLDSFYSVMRLAIFLTILYFNSSPLRCFFVLLIASVIYLYHIGVIRIRHERNNNNINRNNNAAQAQIRQGVRQVQQQQQEQQQVQAQDQPAAAEAGDDSGTQDSEDGSGETDISDDASTPEGSPRPSANSEEVTTADVGVGTDDQEEDNTPVSVIGFVRTFVITFFTSLLPEAPNL